MTTLYIINADAKKFDPPEEKIFSENPVEIYDKLFSSLIQEKKEVVIETVIDGYPLGYHLRIAKFNTWLVDGSCLYYRKSLAETRGLFFFFKEIGGLS